MKILFVTHGPDMMGANRSLLNLIQGLNEYGVESVILTSSEGELTNHAHKIHQKIMTRPYFRWAHTKYLAKKYWLNFQLQKKNALYLEVLSKEVETHQFDVIYSNSSTIGIGAQLADRLNIPHVWRIREFGEEDYNLSYWKGRDHFMKWMNKAAVVSFISVALKNKFINQIKVPTHCIYNGIISQKKLNAIAPVFEIKKKDEPFNFVIIGLIHPNKGQLEAVKAFYAVYKKYPQAKLLIVGKGRRIYAQRIKYYIKQHKMLDNVEFVGYVNDPTEIYKKMDCLLMCSKSEGMGRVTIEAMTYGKPIIGFDGGATTELVKHKENGLIYSKDEELIQHMETLVENRDLVKKYGQNGRSRASEYVTEISAAKEYDIFKNLLR